MVTPERVCTSCGRPIELGASFCTICGEATPTEISSEAETLMLPDKLGSEEREFRERLQRAMGDGFELREVIGSGGFGSVYSAWDKELERSVAVKSLRYDLISTRELVERFRREARAVAKLRHPNILPVYSVGGDENSAFFTMPLIEGESLAKSIAREGALSEHEARRILREAAAALHEAHRSGIVHRDLKPANILLEGQSRRVLLMDFGIAKAVSSDSTQLTLTGMVIGTPRYMSPEQARGDKNVGVPSDIYSLGIVTYEMLTGVTPFSGDSLGEIIAKHLTEEPIDLARTHRASSAFSAMVMTCLRKAPEQRWPTARHLEEALQALEKTEAEAHAKADAAAQASKQEEKQTPRSEDERNAVWKNVTIRVNRWFTFIAIVVAIAVVVGGAAATRALGLWGSEPGTEKWTLAGRFLSICSAVGTDGTVYAGTQDGIFYAVNPDGDVRWVSRLVSTQAAPVVAPDGTVYIETLARSSQAQNPDATGNIVRSISALNQGGTLRWEYELARQSDAGILLDSRGTMALGSNGTIYAGSRDGFVHAINPNGTRKWRAGAGEVTNSSLAVGSTGTIYVGHSRGVRAFTPEGNSMWDVEIERYSRTSLALGGDETIYVGFAIDPGPARGILHAIGRDGTEKWAFNMEGRFESSPLVGSDGTIYVAVKDSITSNSIVYAINASGLLGGTRPLPQPMNSTPALGSDGTVYFTTLDYIEYAGRASRLYALLPNGTTGWSVLIPHPSNSSPTLGADGMVYLPTFGGLYAVEASGKGLADSPWPAFRGDSRNTGRAHVH